MSPSMAVVRSNLYEQIAMQLISMISKGHWKAGEKLPSELELCRSLQVGRSSLREAMKALSFAGVVEVHPGEGTFVSRGPSIFLQRIITQGVLNSADDLEDLLEARMILEPELAALCAQRATDEELSTFDHLIEEMGRALHRERAYFAEIDLSFHIAIATASKNRALSAGLTAVREPLHELIKKGAQSNGACEVAHVHHQKLLQAIRQGSPTRARNEMRSHLRFFQRGYLLASRASDPALRNRSESGPGGVERMENPLLSSRIRR